MREQAPGANLLREQAPSCVSAFTLWQDSWTTCELCVEDASFGLNCSPTFGQYPWVVSSRLDSIPHVPRFRLSCQLQGVFGAQWRLRVLSFGTEIGNSWNKWKTRSNGSYSHEFFSLRVALIYALIFKINCSPLAGS